MNEAGVLGRFIPGISAVSVGMMQFSMYHHYTVDEHLIRTVGELSAIEAGRLAEDLPLATKIVPPDRPSHLSLYLAAFLHDIAKGRGIDHSLAKAPRSRASLGPVTRAQHRQYWNAWHWLIEQHLVMSNMAQGRDLLDPENAGGEARAWHRRSCRTQERLKMLLTLTVADIRELPSDQHGVWERLEGPASAHALLGDRSACSAAAIR